MKDITNNEMKAILSIFKSPELEYNANSLSKVLGISAMGTLKILKRLEKENILVSKELGKAVFYNINFNNPYAKDYLKFLLKREAENPPNIETKVWISDIKNKINKADSAVLFGSILKKGKEANDIDIVFITNQERFKDLNKQIESLNEMRSKKIHPVFQSLEDFKNNIINKDKAVLSAIKGIVIFGEEKIIEALEK